MKHLTVLLAVLLFAVTPVYGSINVELFNSFSDTGSGVDLSSPAGSFTSADVRFGTDNGWEWYPLGQLTKFGARITGTIYKDTDSVDQYILSSSDGSYLFFDGIPATDPPTNGGIHGPNSVFLYVELSAGYHSFEILFFKDDIAANVHSGVDLALPSEGVKLWTFPNRPRSSFGRSWAFSA